MYNIVPLEPNPNPYPNPNPNPTPNPNPNPPHRPPCLTLTRIAEITLTSWS